MNALPFIDAARIDAILMALRCWLLTLLASFFEALEWARRPEPGDGAVCVRGRYCIGQILSSMREAVAEAEREAALLFVLRAITWCTAHRRSGTRPPSPVRADLRRPRRRFDKRLVRPLLREWRSARGGGRGARAGAGARLALRARRLAAAIADPERIISRLAVRLTRLKVEAPWRTAHILRMTSGLPRGGPVIAVWCADTS